MKKFNFLLTAIAVLTLIAAGSIGAILGIFAVHWWYIFIVSSAVGILGLYAYHEASLLYLVIRFKHL